jgi:transcriptional regulator with XRE-family HTH domain
MGRATRPRPERLPEKLLLIRTALGLSQNGMIRRLGLVDDLTQDYISAYERGVREPPLPALLKYAQAAGVYVDTLIDDEVDLPEKLPCQPKHEGVRRAADIPKGRTRRKPARAHE